MKTTAKLFALILAVLMVFGVFAGCDNSATPSTAPSTAPSQKPQESDNPETEDPSPELPLTDTVKEVSVWQAFAASTITSINESSYVDYVEEATNIRLKFHETSTAEATVNFNLMISSQDYPDIIRPGNEGIYPGGGDKAIEDGVYLELTDLINDYIPNYAAIRNKGGEYAKLTISDNGNIWSIWSIKDPAEPAWTGMGIRKDLLDSYGMALPVTIADWEECLTAFRDNGVKYPLLMNQSGVMTNHEFISAWGLGSAVTAGKEMYNVNGEARFGYIQPEFKDYLETMNRWYADGLIDPNFTGRGITFSVAGAGEAATETNLGNVGALPTNWGFSANRRAAAGLTEIADMWIAAVKAPVLNEGDEVQFRYTNYVTAVPNCISTGCDDPALVARLFNFWFSEEGSRMMNYGKEGVSYTMENGAPRYADIIMNDPDGFVARDASLRHVWDDGIGYIDYTRLWQPFEITAPDALLAYDVWGSDGCDYVMPPVSLSTEEGAEYSSIMSDIRTICDESITKFIMGTKPLDEFDAFVAQVNSMNIARAIEIQQTALDRYNAR